MPFSQDLSKNNGYTKVFDLLFCTHLTPERRYCQSCIILNDMKTHEKHLEGYSYKWQRRESSLKNQILNGKQEM